MPQEPKKKHSKARKRTRRASIILKTISLISCKNCGKSTQPHIVCRHCGFYAGKNISKHSKVQITKA